MDAQIVPHSPCLVGGVVLHLVGEQHSHKESGSAADWPAANTALLDADGNAIDVGPNVWVHPVFWLAVWVHYVLGLAC